LINEIFFLTENKFVEKMKDKVTSQTFVFAAFSKGWFEFPTGINTLWA